MNRSPGEAVILGAQADRPLREILTEAGLTTREIPPGLPPLSALAAVADSNAGESLLLCASDLRLSAVAQLDLVDTPPHETAMLTIDRAAHDAPPTGMPPVR
ncbi:hypothetical protein, partial [Intrasporangium sp.]|uniref:hypothetical protein n=1 Tax=Intrasporangium sp. TaxID=1925024 RepID=UPI003F80EFB1